MKLVFRDTDAVIYRLSQREYETLRALLRLRANFPRRSCRLGTDSRSGATDDANEELSNALAQHRTEQHGVVEAMLSDPVRCKQEQSGYLLRLTSTEADTLLQALNEVRIGAWEKLGCPDFDAPEKVSPDEQQFVCYWALHVTNLFQGALLEGLADPDDGAVA